MDYSYHWEKQARHDNTGKMQNKPLGTELYFKNYLIWFREKKNPSLD